MVWQNQAVELTKANIMLFENRKIEVLQVKIKVYNYNIERVRKKKFWEWHWII